MEDSKKRKRESDPLDLAESEASKEAVSTTANTHASIYTAIFNKNSDCNDNRKAIEDECQPGIKEYKKTRLNTAAENTFGLGTEKYWPEFPENPGGNSNSNVDWINNHCEFLMHKPGDKAGLWSEIQKKFTSKDEAIKAIKKKYQNKKNKFSKDMLVAAYMHNLSETNPCITARRCALIKFSDTKPKKPKPESELKAEIQTDKEAADRGATQLKGREHKDNGCCPGQTGHHLLPSAMFGKCDAYKPGQAPTMCVEGANNSNGSHGLIHRKLRDILLELKDEGGIKIQRGEIISRGQAIEAAIASTTIFFLTAHCNPLCIGAQLKVYYDYLKCDFRSDPGVAEGKDSESSIPIIP